MFMLIITSVVGRQQCTESINPQADALSSFLVRDILPEIVKCTPEEERQESLAKILKEQEEYKKNQKPDSKEWVFSTSTNGESDNRNVLFKIKGSKDEIGILKKIMGLNPNNCQIQKINKCNDVICALTKLLGDEVTAYRVLNYYYRTGSYLKIDWPLDFFTCSDSDFRGEIETVKKVVDHLPKEMFPLPYLQEIKLISKESWEENGIAHGAAYKYGLNIPFLGLELLKGRIKLAGLLEKTKEELAFITFHELGHHVDFAFGGSKSFDFSTENKEFLNLSGWQFNKITKKWEYRENQGCFMREYAQANPGEDFADHFSFYITEPAFFRGKCPLKYLYLKKKVFRGKEFDFNQRLTPTEIINQAWDACNTNVEQSAISNNGRIDLLATLPFFSGDELNNKNSNRCMMKLAQLELKKNRHLSCQNRNQLSYEFQKGYHLYLVDIYVVIKHTVRHAFGEILKKMSAVKECSGKNAPCDLQKVNGWLKEEIASKYPFNQLEKTKFDVIYDKLGIEAVHRPQSSE